MWLFYEIVRGIVQEFGRLAGLITEVHRNDIYLVYIVLIRSFFVKKVYE